MQVSKCGHFICAKRLKAFEIIDRLFGPACTMVHACPTVRSSRSLTYSERAYLGAREKNREHRTLVTRCSTKFVCAYT